MSLFDTISAMGGIAPAEYRLTVIGDSGVYCEGVKKLIGFSEGEVVLSTRRGAIRIKGGGLNIAKLAGGDAVIKGRIDGIEKFSV